MKHDPGVIYFDGHEPEHLTCVGARLRMVDDAIRGLDSSDFGPGSLEYVPRFGDLVDIDGFVAEVHSRMLPDSSLDEQMTSVDVAYGVPAASELVVPHFEIPVPKITFDSGITF